MASLVTNGLQSRDPSIVTGPWKEVDLPSLVFITLVVHELQVFYLGSGQRKQTIVLSNANTLAAKLIK